jgi:RAB protein geranylgeranyltransferase component A
MKLLEAINYAERKANASSGAERKQYQDLKEWLELLGGLIACIGHGVCHTWGMKDRECIERCFEMIEEYEEKLER